MKLLFVSNLGLCTAHILLVLYVNVGAIILVYSMSRLLLLIFDLYRYRAFNFNTDRIVTLSLRRLIKIHLFWYEFQLIRNETSANLHSTNNWDVEEECKEETFIDRACKNILHIIKH